MKRFDAKYARVEIGVCFEKFSECASGNIAAASESDVWMPRTEVGLQANRKRSFLDALVKLQKMRVAGADTDPDDFRCALGGKCSDGLDGQKERAKFDCSEFFTQGKIDTFRRIGEKPEREMHLIARGPTDTANARVKFDKSFSD